MLYVADIRIPPAYIPGESSGSEMRSLVHGIAAVVDNQKFNYIKRAYCALPAKSMGAGQYVPGTTMWISGWTCGEGRRNSAGCF